MCPLRNLPSIGILPVAPCELSDGPQAEVAELPQVQPQAEVAGGGGHQPAETKVYSCCSLPL